MIYLVLLGTGVVFLGLAWFFRGALSKAEKPSWVMEKEPWPRDLEKVVRRLERWREEGRISREDFERLTALCREDLLHDKFTSKPLTKAGSGPKL